MVEVTVFCDGLLAQASQCYLLCCLDIENVGSCAQVVCLDSAQVELNFMVRATFNCVFRKCRGSLQTGHA